MNINTIFQIYRILDPSARKKVVLLFVLILIGTFLEIFSIGMFVPILSSLVVSDFASTHPTIVSWLPLLGHLSQKDLIILGISSISILYFIKFIYFILLIRIQGSFVYGVQAKLSQNLFKSYIYKPYIFHLQENSAQLIRNATTEVGVYSGILSAGLNLITEALVLVGIVAVLLYVQPFSTLVIASSLFLSLYLYQYFTRGHILRWGQERQYHEGKRIQFLQQGFGGIKDSKLLGREGYFIKQYNSSTFRVADVGRKQYVLQQIPRYWLELLVMVVLSLLVLTTILQSKPFEEIIPIIGLFSIASFRMMPSSNRILNSLQRIRHGIPVISLISREINLLREGLETKELDNDSNFNFSNYIQLEKVSFSYPSSEIQSITDINIKITKGDFVGIIGSSGAGKSTLVDIILGLLHPQIGVISVDGFNIHNNLKNWQYRIGYVPQSIYLTDDTLKRNIAFGVDDRKIDDEALKMAITSAQLLEFIDSLPKGLETIVGERGMRISGGQRQRIGIARALYHNPEVLVLDEATSSLDVATEKKIMKSINLLIGSKTIIIISHRYTTVSDCSHIYKIDKGEVVQDGTYSELIEK